mmetsp:Transcript_25438/g.71981  ORF Transcript_25438/g.71981 Transcript_25438/m.71981 type:complete len:267 (-) Transcript_25438:222-1022(-)
MTCTNRGFFSEARLLAGLRTINWKARMPSSSAWTTLMWVSSMRTTWSGLMMPPERRKTLLTTERMCSDLPLREQARHERGTASSGTGVQAPSSARIRTWRATVGPNATLSTCWMSRRCGDMVVMQTRMPLRRSAGMSSAKMGRMCGASACGPLAHRPCVCRSSSVWSRSSTSSFLPCRGGFMMLICVVSTAVSKAARAFSLYSCVVASAMWSHSRSLTMDSSMASMASASTSSMASSTLPIILMTWPGRGCSSAKVASSGRVGLPL